MFRILYRHFLGQFFENELISPQGEMRSGMVGVLALIATPGLLLPLAYFSKYSPLLAFVRQMRAVDRDLATYPDKMVFLTAAIVIPALAALMKWDTLFPTRTDHSILVPLPVRLPEIFLAKSAALFSFVLLFALAVNGAASILFPLVVMGDTGTLLSALRYIGAQFVSTMAASVAMCSLLVAVQGVGLSLIGLERFRRISAMVQFVLLTSLLTLLLLTSTLGDMSRRIRTTELAAWLPPFWFLGLYETLLGKADAVFLSLGLLAGQTFGLCLSVAVATYALSYTRHFRRIPEILERGSTLAAPVWGWLERWAGGTRGRAPKTGLLFFVLKVLSRSHLHRLLFGVFLAVAAALLADTALTVMITARDEPGEVLSAPLIVSFFLITGFRFLYEVPVDLPAQWLFRLNVPDRPETFHRYLLLPVTLVVLPVNFALLPGAVAGLHSLYCLCLALVLNEAVFLGFRKVPFTCTFAAAKWNVTFALALWFLVFVVYTWLAVRVEAFLLRSVEVFLGACLGLVGVFAWLARRRRELWEEDPRIQFSDGQSPAVQTLDLGD
jgi:hypothetical protein